MNNNATFTPAASSDIEVLLRFNRELNEYDGTPFDEARTRMALANLIGRPDLGEVWLIGVAGRPAGGLPGADLGLQPGVWRARCLPR